MSFNFLFDSAGVFAQNICITMHYNGALRCTICPGLSTSAISGLGKLRSDPFHMTCAPNFYMV